MSLKRFLVCVAAGAVAAINGMLGVIKVLHLSIPAWISVLPLVVYTIVFALGVVTMVTTRFGLGRTAKSSGWTHYPTGWGAAATGFVACSAARWIVEIMAA